MLLTLLSVEGYQPVLVTDGLEGLMVAHSLRPALITLDLSLPTLDGSRLLDQLDNGPSGTGRPKIPVIVISAYTDQLSSAHRARVSAILTKPFEIDSLLSAISAVLGPA